ncbi:hypothetical protein ACTTAK_13155 [Rhodobacter capsulatus]|uniref:hypothetical protein n=1 Tax=Rhodobacter capsulatus TaxID=1061 RepID=UPI001141AAA5|nr:hypothetical protein [Rhodobacter capsulatus]TQD33452.1 hypothetical protein FKW81_14635 [Rhodobacter capsulatus]
MDRISGLMPQVGWSPLLSMVPPKKAPATTVEPANTSSGTNSGMGAEVGTQAQPERSAQLQARNRDVAVETAVLAQSRAEAVPDPDAPTGPPPTFDVTPLEAKAAALMAVPPQEEAPAAASAALREPAQPPAEPAVSAEPQAPAPAEAAPRAETAPEPAPQPVPQPTPDWQATSETAEPSLDVVR